MKEKNTSLWQRKEDKMIAIIAAMQAEVDALLQCMDSYKEEQVSGIFFYVGSLAGKETVCMLSGVGKGNAAMSTTILMHQYHPSQVINIGTAGGLVKEQKVLDIVVSSQVIQHDYDTSALDGEAGIGLLFSADRQLVQQCVDVFTAIQAPYHIGVVASGDQFIAKDEQLLDLMKKFPKAICAEMEAGAIAQVCTHFQVPFIVIRSLSDIAHQEKSEMDFLSYVHKASERSSMFCKKIVEKLA